MTKITLPLTLVLLSLTGCATSSPPSQTPDEILAEGMAIINAHPGNRAAAISPPTPALNTPEGATCDSIRRLTEGIMEMRQAGVSMGEALGIANSSPDASIRAEATGFVNSAYSQPDYASDEAQQRAITNFANDQEIECFQNLT